jgi:hypothetical protein
VKITMENFFSRTNVMNSFFRRLVQWTLYTGEVVK